MIPQPTINQNNALIPAKPEIVLSERDFSYLVNGSAGSLWFTWLCRQVLLISLPLGEAFEHFRALCDFPHKHYLFPRMCTWGTPMVNLGFGVTFDIVWDHSSVGWLLPTQQA